MGTSSTRKKDRRKQRKEIKKAEKKKENWTGTNNSKKRVKHHLNEENNNKEKQQKQKTTITTCVFIPRNLGEPVRKFLLKKGLLNLNLKVKQEGDKLHFPVIRSLKNHELTEVKSIIGKKIEEENCYFETFRSKKRDNLSSILKEKIPRNLLELLPKSYDRIGELIIVEIPETLTSYSQIIGETLLKIHKVKGVYKKAGKVEGKKRVRKLEILAGKDDPKTIHLEYGVRLFIDIKNTYFSPRLGNEHQRIAKQVKSGEIVFDTFTGVGSFAIHIAKKTNAKVYATDINPHAIDALKKSLNLNKLKGTIIPLTLNAREAAETLLKNQADRIIMNLPEKAHEYIEVACTALKEKGGIIHFYTFIKYDPTVTPKMITIRKEAIFEKAETLLRNAVKTQGRTVEKILNKHLVKTTAPYQEQVVLDTLIT